MAPLIAPAAFRLPSDEALRARFGHVTTWVFDLDNTLYPPDSGIWPQDRRADHAVSDRAFRHRRPVGASAAQALLFPPRHDLARTDRGAASTQTERFLEFVHDIDRSGLKPDPILAREVATAAGAQADLHQRLAKPRDAHREPARPRWAFRGCFRHCRGGADAKADRSGLRRLFRAMPGRSQGRRRCSRTWRETSPCRRPKA